MKKTILIVILLLNLTACSDYKEVEDITIVTAISLDSNIDEPSIIDVCIEAVKFSQSSSDVYYVNASGKTYPEAITNAITITGNELYFSHTSIMIIGEQLANEGIENILDSIYRSSSFRLDMSLLIAKDAKASEILQTPSLIDDIAGIQLEKIIASNSLTSEVTPMPVYKFVDYVVSDGAGGVLPVVIITNDFSEPVREISGVALFKDDYIYSYLDAKQTKTMGLLNNNMSKGTAINEYTVSTPTYVIESASTKVTPNYKDGKLSFDFEVYMELSLAENGSDLLSPQSRENMQNEISLAIQKDCDDLIKTQMIGTGCDFLELGSKIYKKYPDLWEEIQFSDYLSDLDYTLSVDCKIINSGLMLKPLEIN